MEEGGFRSDRVACGLALCLCRTQPPQRAVLAQQLFVEGAHAAAGEGMQRSLEQPEALGSLYPVLVAVVVQTGHQFLGHRDQLARWAVPASGLAKQHGTAVSLAPPLRAHCGASSGCRCRLGERRGATRRDFPSRKTARLHTCNTLFLNVLF